MKVVPILVGVGLIGLFFVIKRDCCKGPLLQLPFAPPEQRQLSDQEKAIQNEQRKIVNRQNQSEAQRIAQERMGQGKPGATTTGRNIKPDVKGGNSITDAIKDFLGGKPQGYNQSIPSPTRPDITRTDPFKPRGETLQDLANAEGKANINTPGGSAPGTDLAAGFENFLKGLGKSAQEIKDTIQQDLKIPKFIDPISGKPLAEETGGFIE